MLKKSLEVLSLLMFVFAFAVPLLVLTNPAVGSDNYTITQPYTAYYYCADGTLLYTSTGTSSNTATVNHPEDLCYIERDEAGERWIVCYHRPHGMTYVYNSNEVSYIRSASAEACR